VLTPATVCQLQSFFNLSFSARPRVFTQHRLRTNLRAIKKCKKNLDDESAGGGPVILQGDARSLPALTSVHREKKCKILKPT